SGVFTLKTSASCMQVLKRPCTPCRAFSSNKPKQDYCEAKRSLEKKLRVCSARKQTLKRQTAPGRNLDVLP
ncbi:MAG: hypothetical protein ABIZ81_01415, partial [Opitutaceae bacterium]